MAGLSLSECFSPSTYPWVTPAKLSGDPGNRILWTLFVTHRLSDCSKGIGSVFLGP